MLYDGYMHHRRGKPKSVERSGLFRSAVAATCYGCQLTWAMLARLSCEIITFVARTLLFWTNKCSAINFYKKTNGSTTISIAKQNVPRTRACARQSISSRKPMVRQPFRSQNLVSCLTFVCRWHMPVYFRLKKQGSVFQLGRGAWAASPPRETALRITKESMPCKPYSCSFCETSELI